MFGVTFQPVFVGWLFRHGCWEAACSGMTRQAVARELRARYGAAAATQVLERGVVPTAPILDSEVRFRA